MEDKYHVLLRKQIKKVLGDEKKYDSLPAEVKTILDLVNKTYFENEKEKQLLGRSIDISSREYKENIEKINKMQAQIISNEKMAGIGQLSAGIAHEINNPLSFVLGNMNMIKKYFVKIKVLYDLNKKLIESYDECFCDELKAQIFEISMYIKENDIEYIAGDLDDITNDGKEGIDRIAKIVKSLLNFARKGYEEEFTRYDINGGIRDTLTIANNSIKYCAKVNEEFTDVPCVLAIAGQINQVILNLIMNATHAIKSKGILGNITVHTHNDENFVYCEITDDGCGISEKHMNKIFDPFFTTKPVGEGTGLGLSIAHDIIVSKHNGNIEVRSIVGEGTKFIITLPIDR
ncbi:MAG TPA: histidine kinase [Clostridiales bacterium]|nr:MAG: histidine kinase [Clostridiales bacterium GWD2_32_19]HCC07496.1 histidine kinase [Clostridiales bacterium]